MAKKKKVEIPERKVVWHIQDDGSVSPIIQNQKQDIAPVQTKQSGFFKGSDAKNNWSIETDNPFMNVVQRANATLWGTILDAGTNVVRGATSSVEGIGDFAQNRVADVQDLFGHNKAAEKTRRKSEQVWGINQKIDDFDSIMNTTSVLGDKSDAVFQGVGTSLFAMGTGALGGAIGGTNAAASILSLGTMGLGAAGNSENQARQEMMADLKKYGFNTKQINNASRMYGLLSGVGETLSEMMFGGISQTSKVFGIGTGLFNSADDAVINALTKRLKTGIFKNFVQAGLKASGEGLEEIASAFLDAAAKKMTYMKKEDFGKIWEDEKWLDSFISGTLSATLTQMPSAFKSVATVENGKIKLKNNNEIRDFVSNLNTQEQQVVEREIENRLAQEENPTNRRRMQIEKQVMKDLDRGYISANTIRETLGENYNPERDIRLNESFNEEARRSQSFEADLSKYEGKQKEIVQDAIESGLLNNTNKTHDMVDWVSKICADKGLDFGFTNNENIKNTGFAIDGKQVNGFIQDGKIMLNLESNQALNKTVGHEITHVLEGTDLYNSLQDSLKSFMGEREWNNRISELEKTYKGVKGANIENELTSDLVGEYVFNDESFVKSLSTKNPNLFQKIFDEIKYMVKIATAGSKEARDLEKVKRAFEKAYRETSKTQKGTQYSIQAIDDKRLYTLNDGKRKLDLSNLDTAGEKLARYINNNIRNYKDVVVDAIDGDKLTITKDTAYKIASRDNVKNTNGKMEKLSDDLYGVKLRAGMYIDELAKTSRRRGNPAPDTKNHSFAKDGFIYRDTYYMDDDGQYYKITISTGKNGEVNTIYNLGKIKETELPQVAQRPDSKTIGEAQVSTDKNISQKANNVKYSITQDSNGNEVDGTSFSLEQRVSGDKLLDAQDLIEEVKNVGAEVDDNGYITVYHQTNNENAQKIRETGEMLSKEPYIYFSTSKDAQQSQGRGETKLEFKIPAENLILDDLFSDNADVKIALNGKKTLDISNYLVDNDTKYSISKRDNLNQLTKDGIYMSYVRDPNNNANQYKENYKNVGLDFGQDIEPSGEYMSMDTLEGKNKIDGYEYGYIDFKNPLIIDNEDTTSNGWKKDLSNMYNGLTGKELSNAIMQDGYDAVMSRDNKGNIVEVVNLNGTKQNNQNTKYSLTEDSQGRQLSEQQQEYFKDSVTKNENGELQIYYNGGGDYTTFDNTKMSDQSKWGKGIYLTKDSDIASSYGENVKEVYANITNPLSQTEKTISFEQYNELSKALYDEGAYREEYDMFDNDLDLLWDITNKGNWADYANEIKEYTGKDGLIIEDEDTREDMAIAFNSNQIKNVDNTNPTENDDIRYQLGNNEVAPTSGWNVRSEDVRLQSAFKDTIAPLQEQVQELSNSINELKENIPKYKAENIQDEETDFSDVNIDKDIQDMTIDDIDASPFLEGLQGARERQTERQQQREEISQKKEVKIPKQSNGRRAVNRGKGLLVNEFAVLDDYSKQTKNKDIKFKTDTYNNYQAIAQSNIETAQTDINGKRIGRSGNSIFEEAKRYGLADTFDEYLKQWANVDRAKQGKGAANFSAKESYKIVKEMEAKNPRLKKLGADMWQYYRNARHNLRDAGIISQEVSDMLGRMYPHYTPYISENIENYFVKDGELKPKATIKRAKGGAAIGSLLNAEEAMQRYTKSEFNTIFGNDLFKEIVKTSNDIVQLGGDDRGMQFVNADNLYADKNGYYLTAYENGNPITAKISEDMYRTLTRESRNRISDIENTFSAVTKPLQGLSKLRRNILTSWSPTFMAKNFIKDFQEGIFNSKYTKDFIKNYPSAFKELATNTELAQQFKSLYGSGLTMGQYDIDANNYNPSGKNKNFLKGIKNVNELIELAPRYAEFKASIDHGASIQEAMYNAREVTTNFSRGGTLAKALNRNGFTFLNSSIQGFDKFIRNFSGENGAKGIVNSLAKAAIFGIAPAIFNELAFGSGDDKDEEYEALPDYIKDNYYLIKTGDGNFIRIPKGRVFSVFGSAARRTIEAMEGEENAFEGYWNNVQQQIGINNPEENNIFAPLIQAMGGRKLDSGQTAGEAWYGGDIIPSRLQKERPEDQYDASIDKFSIWLGQRTGISPYKINYVLDQYTGGIGDIGLPMITDEANSDGSIIAPIKDQFTADTITDNKYVSEFYDTKNKLYTGSKATDEDILKSKYMNDISKQMGELYAERREIQADTTLTKKEKYEKAQAIKSEINRLAKEGLDNYEKAGITGDYANTNGQEYQKTEDGWRKLNENTSDELNLLGLTSREKNNYIKTKQNISSIKEKYKDSDDYNGKKNEIIGEIINTNLDDNSKLSLYQDTYRDKLANSIDDLGINADTYLEYKAQDFSADKDKNGKSISGSKKRKVFDYINSLDIPYQQKLILAKSEYNSFNDNNAEIIEYIENSGMDYSERIELYKNLGFKVDGDNISW